MSLSRRHLLYSALGLAIPGCASHSGVANLPRTPWPAIDSPAPRRNAGGPYKPPIERPSAAPSTAGLGTPASPIPRSTWARYGVDLSNVYPLGGVRRITIHHEGNPEPVYFSDQATTRDHLEQVRQAHRGRGWADIGYHYIIDVAGRVWEGRPIQYQGAHVKDNNENNLGVMVLGNFNEQYPSDAQLSTLRDMVRHLRRTHNVNPREIYTHRELGPTACPGANLQPRVASMRSAGQFV